MTSARGTLDWLPLSDRLDLVAGPVAEVAPSIPEALVAQIGPALADTAAFCDAYDIAPDSSANCVVVSGRRSGETRYAAAMVLATTRADVNGVIRHELDVRKCSFAPMDDAVALTGMEYGGITPAGLPHWPVLVDDGVVEAGDVVIGSGLRRSKILLPAITLLRLPGARRLRLSVPTG